MTPGEFRTHQVAIGVNQRFIPPPRTAVTQCLADFEKYLNSKTDPDSLVHCFLCHYQFETIHPFTDGNGRVGRLLLALMFHRLCGLTKPWLYLSDILERQRDDYCQALFEVSASGNWSGWLELCLKATIEQANETLGRCEKLNGLRTEFTQRASSCGGNARIHQLVDLLFQSPFLRVANLTKLLDVSYPTAKSDCERLVDCNILQLLPNVSPATYFSREIFEVAYEGIG
jgi:Fic family protein